MPGSAISSELVETQDPGTPIYCLDMSGQKFGAEFLQMVEQPTSWKTLQVYLEELMVS